MTLCLTFKMSPIVRCFLEVDILIGSMDVAIAGYAIVLSAS